MCLFTFDETRSTKMLKVSFLRVEIELIGVELMTAARIDRLNKLFNLSNCNGIYESLDIFLYFE